MKYWVFCTIGLIGLFMFAASARCFGGEKNARRWEKGRTNIYSVLEVRDEDGKIGYVIVEASKMRQFKRARLAQNKRARREWKELPASERRRRPEPRVVKISIRKQGILGREKAEAYREKYLAKIPRSQWSTEGMRQGQAGKKAKDARKFLVAEIRDEYGKYSYVVLPVDEARAWGQKRKALSLRIIDDWKKKPEEERGDGPEPKAVRLKVVRSDIPNRKEAESICAHYVKAIPERLRSSEASRQAKKAEARARRDRERPRHRREQGKSDIRGEREGGKVEAKTEE